ncbi:MAG: hypothetical protein NVS9B3_02750 [Gemmatimonadaceae bacterium]
MAVTTTACAVSTQQEVDLGTNYAAQIEQQLPIVHEPEIERYINVLGDSIAKLTSRGTELEWHFFVVNAKEINAFAVPGGFVYVNRGLIDRADKMDQLAGVIGHEIGHVVKRHSIKQMQQMQKANIGVTLACVLTRVCESDAAQAAINVGAGAVFAKFSRGDEKEADDVGIANVVRAGISPRGIPEMFEKLLNERRARPGGVEAWFASHPLEEDRIADTEHVIATYDPAILHGLIQDSPNFHRFKERLASLPAPPPPRQRAQ